MTVSLSSLSSSSQPPTGFWPHARQQGKDRVGQTKGCVTSLGGTVILKVVISCVLPEVRTRTLKQREKLLAEGWSKVSANDENQKQPTICKCNRLSCPSKGQTGNRGNVHRNATSLWTKEIKHQSPYQISFKAIWLNTFRLDYKCIHTHKNSAVKALIHIEIQAQVRAKGNFSCITIWKRSSGK